MWWVISHLCQVCSGLFYGWNHPDHMQCSSVASAPNSCSGRMQNICALPNRLSWFWSGCWQQQSRACSAGFGCCVGEWRCAVGWEEEERNAASLFHTLQYTVRPQSAVQSAKSVVTVGFPQLKLWVAWCTATVYLEVFRWQLRAGSWPPLAACHSRLSEPSLFLSQGVFFSFSFFPPFFSFSSPFLSFFISSRNISVSQTSRNSPSLFIPYPKAALSSVVIP